MHVETPQAVHTPASSFITSPPCSGGTSKFKGRLDTQAGHLTVHNQITSDSWTMASDTKVDVVTLTVLRMHIQSCVVYSLWKLSFQAPS